MSVYAQTAGDGPPVVLLHAGICDSRMWDPQWEALQREHRVLRLDMRGFGHSPLAPGELCNGDDVLAAMDRFDMPRAAVVGASMGGAVALDVILAAPERFSALVLVDAPVDGHDWSTQMRETWEAEEEFLEDGDIDAAVRLTVRFWVDGPGRAEGAAPPDVRAFVAEMQRRAFELQIPVGDAITERELSEDAGARLGEISAPTLVVCGEEDVADFRAISERLAAEIPGARSATIPDAAHLPSLERPESFDAVALPFLLEYA